MNEQLSPQVLKKTILNFLREHKSASLATCLNEMPRSSPVQYFLGEDLELYILSAGGEKFQAIESNQNVCLLVNTEYITYRKIKGVQIFGTATTCSMDSKVKEEAKRYCADPYINEEEIDHLQAIKIVPNEIVYLDSLSEGNRTKQVLKNMQVEMKPESISSHS